jgi:predicted ArsR family transcriptional regulator
MGSMDSKAQEEVSRIALLDNPIRAALYRELIERDGWLGRDEAAKLVEVPRSVAAFHLDKMSEAGLIEAKYVRTSGRTGPGAGRPSKLYRRSDRETAVSLPERKYSFVGHLLASAVEESTRTGKDVGTIVARLANEKGAELAERSGGPRKRLAADALIGALKEVGYEPRISKDEILLRNCPFHELSRQHTELVCGMNLDLLKGLVEGITSGRMTPRLAPEPGMCCVRISKKARPKPRANR